ncbi:MAG: ATPase, partial [Bacteroidota bacterium]
MCINIMASQTFIGRKKELAQLQILHNKQIASLVVVKGRRRIGKSRLITEFASQNKRSKLWSFAGLAPQEGMDAQSQRDHFARQLALLRKVPPFTFQDWSDALQHLALHLRASDIVLLDEISWMGDKDPSFIPKLKAW